MFYWIKDLTVFRTQFQVFPEDLDSMIGETSSLYKKKTKIQGAVNNRTVFNVVIYVYEI